MTETTSYRDRESGVEVIQVTNYRGHSHHFYFTNPGWYAGGKKLLFGSDRNNRTNLFGVDLATGAIQQTHPHPRLSPDGSYVVFSSDRSGYGNVYMVRVPEFESLPPTKD